jgi:hypothetical protein
MAFALPDWEQLGPSSICSTTNSVAVVPSQRCRTSAGLTATTCGRESSARGLAGASYLSWTRQLSLEDTTRQMCPLQQSNCDSFEPPASTVNAHSTTLYKNTRKRPPPEGFLFRFFNVVLTPCAYHA